MLINHHIAGAESVVYEGTLNGDKVAFKKPILSLSEHINKFHQELQLLWYACLSLIYMVKLKLAYFAGNSLILTFSIEES